MANDPRTMAHEINARRTHLEGDTPVNPSMSAENREGHPPATIDEIDARINALDAEQNADFALLDKLGDPTDPLVVSRRIRLRTSYRRELARLRLAAAAAKPEDPRKGQTLEYLARNTRTNDDSAGETPSESTQVHPTSEVTPHG